MSTANDALNSIDADSPRTLGDVLVDTCELASVPEQSGQASVHLTEFASQNIADGANLTRRRIQNDYSFYKPISVEPGIEQIRLLHIFPPENGDEDNDGLVCALFDVPLREDCTAVYTALSYCWGDMTQQRTINLIHHSFVEKKDSIYQHKETEYGVQNLFTVSEADQRPFNITESLYQALKSLRKSRSQLQQRHPQPMFEYLLFWVDALCIDQSNIKERNSQVSIMRQIYTKATLVFMWMGEDKDIKRAVWIMNLLTKIGDHLYGDDFNMLDPSEKQLNGILCNAKFKSGDEVINTHQSFQILSNFFANPYFRRIWVLQEASCKAACTLLHVTDVQFVWDTILFADRFCSYLQTQYFVTPQGILPAAWRNLLQARLLQTRESQKKNTEAAERGEESSYKIAKFDVLGSLYDLFQQTCHDFQATDLRDNLYAIFSFASETQGDLGVDHELAPDYAKSESEVYVDFTIWCIKQAGHLGVLSLLCCGPRRILPEDLADFEANKPLPQWCLDATVHPSWALWPRPRGRSFESSSIMSSKVGEHFDLASACPTEIINLASFDIELPDGLDRRLLGLGGLRISRVAWIVWYPIKLHFTDKDPHSILRETWTTEDVKEGLQDAFKWAALSLSHPCRDEEIEEGGLVLLWGLIMNMILPDDSDEDDETQERETKMATRYQGKEDLLFRDFFETLLMSPSYRGENSLHHQSDDGPPDGPWNDETIATSFAMYWSQYDSHFELIPPSIAEILRKRYAAGSLASPEQFPFLTHCAGKCFFMTVDHRMGWCQPETRAGDLVLALAGSAVPFTVRPVRDTGKSEGHDWNFKGSETVKNQLYRFIGECYVHECMTSSFLEDLVEMQGDTDTEWTEGFILC